MDKIAILDFGSQFAHLLANRIRRLGVYSEILDSGTPAEKLKGYKGIIISGGPASVNDKNSPKIDPLIYNLKIPILGVCYGHQLTMSMLGGKVEKGRVGEYGLTNFTVEKSTGVLSKLKTKTYKVYASHFDIVSKLPKGFCGIGSTKDDKFSATQNEDRKIYTVQFHPEVTHTECGTQILDEFIEITGASRDWSIEKFIKSEIDGITKKVGDKNVFMLISGGVDSTVAYALLVKAIGEDRIYAMLVDTGFMRFREIEEVKKSLAKIRIKKLHIEDAGDEYFKALKGVTNPEQKRKIIGDKFLEIQRRVAKKLNLDKGEWLLGQGTIYPDTIESGGTKNADKIKTHHNRVPEIEEMIKKGEIIEPLKELYKDEVRKVGEKLGLPKAMVNRHPFPGPGLAVRCLCVDGPDGEYEKLGVTTFNLENSKNVFIEHVLPIKSVGVQGDERTYRHPLVIELAGPHDWNALRFYAPFQTNKDKRINRVILKVDTHDHKKIESVSIVPATLTPERIALLQKVDAIVTQALPALDPDHKVWQFPVVLVPVSINGASPESIVLRPISSTEAMTANFTELPWDGPHGILALAQKILALTDSHGHPQISAVFYDITNKPPATIEWE